VPRVCVDQCVDFRPVDLEAATRDALAYFARFRDVLEFLRGFVREISIDPDSSLQTTVLDKDFIDALPDNEDELTQYLTDIAGSRGGAGNNATFVIDGFTGGRIPPKDQIQEIRISNNPFSTEFSGIGYGRTEIINCIGAIKDPELDLEVYPGDKIHVPRKMF